MTVTHEEIVEFVKYHTAAPNEFEACKDNEEVWTSFERIEVALAAEEAFDIRFETDELNAIRSPSNLISAIARALSIGQ